jgi:hypothetical protein
MSHCDRVFAIGLETHLLTSPISRPRMPQYSTAGVWLRFRCFIRCACTNHGVISEWMGGVCLSRSHSGRSLVTICT